MDVCIVQDEDMEPRRFMVCPPRSKPGGKSKTFDSLRDTLDYLRKKGGIPIKESMDLVELANSNFRPATTVRSKAGAEVTGLAKVEAEDERQTT